MTVQILAGILCAAGMFLFGVDAMGDAITNVCGKKMKHILAVCTKNRFTAVLTGFAVTTVIQSSCASTVAAMSFIDSGILTLSQAVGIIMGANIGTTSTSLLMAFNFGAVAPFAVFSGAAMKMFSKNKKVKNIGIALFGFGLMFTSMSSMSEYLSYFKESGNANSVLSFCTSPLKSILTGFAVTAVMQSSSATVGVLQSAAASRIVSMKTCIFILFGQNIGAVVPTLLSSFKSSREAKQAACVHLLFNLFGTVIFILIAAFTPYISIFESMENKKLAVSLAHIIFNVGSTVVLFPFAERIADVSGKIALHSTRNLKKQEHGKPCS